MKLFSTIAVAGALTLSLPAAEKLTLNQAPDPVQNTIIRQRGKDQIKSIQRKDENGKPVYEVEFSEPGLNPTLWIGQDGTILREHRPELVNAPDGVPVIRQYRSMALTDLPEAVKKTVTDKAAGRPIAEIATESWRGKKVYQIEFQQPGPNEQIYVAEDGTLFKDERFLSALGSVLKGTKFADTPAAVQETVRREAGGQKVKNVDTKRRDGQTIYEVEIEQPGKNYELSLAQDGSILRDTRKGETVGRPAGSEFGFGKSVGLSDVPAPVQNTIKTQSEAGNVVRIREKARGGRNVYAVEFERQGINKRIEIDETGAILKDNLPNK